MQKISPLQQERLQYVPKLPGILTKNIDKIVLQFGEKTTSVADQEALSKIFVHSFGRPTVHCVEGTNSNPKIAFPLKVGVILSGGQAPGGHNVIAGLFHGLKKGNEESQLIGFLDGPGGLVEGKYAEITHEIINAYMNTGGFDIIGSGRTKIETPEQMAVALKNASDLHLDAIVIIGGDDSNTNAALLAEYFMQNGSSIQVIGIPKTIDGDLKNEQIETSFGFDTATKVYSELIGNIARDTCSSKKYWHFIRLMGRSASHITLECGLQTQANVCLISEEIEEKQMTLQQITTNIADVIAKRAEKGLNFGIVLLPEGLVEFVPEMKRLIAQLNSVLAAKGDELNIIEDFQEKLAWLKKNLSSECFETFATLPMTIASQFLAERDPHGNVQVSRIETEKLLVALVEKELAKRKKTGTYCGKFSHFEHFFGYEGRCAFPSNFDADYCYSLGFNAFILIANGLTGYLSSVTNLTSPAADWVVGGIPLTMMMNIEERNGKNKPVIRKALVELDGAPFKKLQEKRDVWAVETSFLFPGSIQYFGPSSVCDAPTKTLLLEKE